MKYNFNFNKKAEGDSVFINNSAKRVPVALVLDVSASMNASSFNLKAIDELNRGIEQFYRAVKKDTDAFYAVDLTIITFGSKADVVQEFMSLKKDSVAPDLKADGLTFMGTGVNLALDHLEDRKKVYHETGKRYYQPWLILMTDGRPEGENENEVSNAIRRVVELETAGKLTIVPIGIGNNADDKILKQFSKRNKPTRLQNTDFAKFFTWLSQSVVSVSNGSMNEIPVMDFDEIFKS